MLAIKLAAVSAALLAAGVVRDRRSFSNAVFLGISLALLALGLAYELVRAHDRVVLLGLFALIAIGPFAVAGYLILNGLIVTRREGLRPGNALSLLAGIAILVVIALGLAAERTGSDELNLMSVVSVLAFGYISFLFVSYVVYAFIYGLLGYGRNADFVVVLGSGLKGGGRVPPLLASRLDRGRAVFQQLAGRGRSPVMIVSGGKGSDEQVSEAAAMAGYLAASGFPADRIVREDRSTSTEENLIYSKAIMERARPGYACVIVTSNFHVFRAAMIARRTGINGQVTGARTAGYYWPTAMIREFGAVFLTYKWVNAAVCLLIIAPPLALALYHHLR
jgi:uncharacterized SAM-binding protein YcdF (DUF218 family)